jgi:two-component system response regulator YesN
MRLYANAALALYNHILGRNLAQEAAFHLSLFKLIDPSAHGDWEEAVQFLLASARAIARLERERALSHAEGVVKGLMGYIDENIDGDLSLVALAERVHYNPSYLSRLFKRVAGGNLNQYVLNLRMERARSLLRDTRLTVSSIAGAVGFDNAQYFTTAFKRFFGLTPQALRDNDVNK